MARKRTDAMEDSFRKKGRPRNVEITVAQIASMDPPELRVFRAMASGYEVSETGVGGTTREKYRRVETPFDQAKRHGWITPEQHRAAEVLSLHFQKGGLLPSTTMKWASFVDGTKGDASGNEVNARDRHARKFRTAISEIPVDYRDGFITWFMDAMAEDVNVASLGALYSQTKHYEARKAMGIFVLQRVLSVVARHYGISL